LYAQNNHAGIEINHYLAQDAKHISRNKQALFLIFKIIVDGVKIHEYKYNTYLKHIKNLK